MRWLLVFKSALVCLTGLFVAFHTQKFLQNLEPNLILSWTASLLIEGFLISLALSRGLLRLMIIPVFAISTLTATASFVVENEEVLSRFITQKRLSSQLEKDIQEEQKAYGFGERYITKTLQRERQLRDQLRDILASSGSGELQVAKAVVFFVFVFVLQLASILTAMSLKKELISSQQAVGISTAISEFPRHMEIHRNAETEIVETAQKQEGISEFPTETETDFSETRRNGRNGFTEMAETTREPTSQVRGDELVAKVTVEEKMEIARWLQSQDLDRLSRQLNISKVVLFKASKYPAYPMSARVFNLLKAHRLKSIGGESNS